MLVQRLLETVFVLSVDLKVGTVVTRLVLQSG